MASVHTVKITNRQRAALPCALRIGTNGGAYASKDLHSGKEKVSIS
jgi:hypothetical protein